MTKGYGPNPFIKPPQERSEQDYCILITVCTKLGTINIMAESQN